MFYFLELHLDCGQTRTFTFMARLRLSAPVVGLLCPLFASIIVSSQQSCPLTRPANHIWWAGWGSEVGNGRGAKRGGAPGSRGWWLPAGRSCSDGNRFVSLLMEHCHGLNSLLLPWMHMPTLPLTELTHCCTFSQSCLNCFDKNKCGINVIYFSDFIPKSHIAGQWMLLFCSCPLNYIRDLELFNIEQKD